MSKNGKGHTAVIVLGYLTLLTIAAFLVFLIVKWMKENEAGSPESVTVNSGSAILAEEKLPDPSQVILSKEELDAMLEEASSSAVQDMETLQQEALDSAVENARMEVLTGIRDRLSTGDESAVEVLRPYYPDDIVLVSSGKFHFVPINRDLKMNTFTADNLNVLESGEFQYLDNGQVISHKGIDVSSHQGDIDWKAVASDGVEFTFIRIAYRGYGKEGKLVDDAKFDRNMRGALDAGLHVGVYIFSQAITEQEALEEADLVLKKLEPYGVKCPIVYDVEKTASATGRMNQLTPEERTNMTIAFCEAIEKAGYPIMIYHNMEMATLMIDIETFEKYGKWFAYYKDDMYYPYEYKIWQYSDTGRVKGVKGDVDLDISFGAFWEE